jgi:tetratricopeptide (TPR) repeat protein
MTRLIKILLIPLILCFTLIPTFSAISGGVDYTIPIDYSKYNQSDLESKAEFYYNSALKSKKLDEDMTSALNLYAMLSNAFPENINYALKLGKLFDIIGKDRYAKGQYYRAMGLNKSRPEPYYYLGDYYYEREQYRKALKFYQKAYDNGYSSHYMTLEKLGDIYQKFGDTEKSVQYLQCAASINPNNELDKKLNQAKNSDNSNKEYYKK